MEIVIDCFGVTARLAGAVEHRITLVPGARISDALAALGARIPELALMLPQCACAIGTAVVPRTQPLHAGARVALLPPVSGG